MLSQSDKAFDVLISDHDDEDIEISIEEVSDGIRFYPGNKKHIWNEYSIAALIQVKEELERLDPKPSFPGKDTLGRNDKTCAE